MYKRIYKAYQYINNIRIVPAFILAILTTKGYKFWTPLQINIAKLPTAPAVQSSSIRHFRITVDKYIVHLPVLSWPATMWQANPTNEKRTFLIDGCECNGCIRHTHSHVWQHSRTRAEWVDLMFTLIKHYNLLSASVVAQKVGEWPQMWNLQNLACNMWSI